MARGFTCIYCERKLSADYRNGWEPKRAVCHSCMDEVRALRRDWEEEWAAYSDAERAEFMSAAEEMN